MQGFWELGTDLTKSSLSGSAWRPETEAEQMTTFNRRIDTCKRPQLGREATVCFWVNEGARRNFSKQPIWNKAISESRHFKYLVMVMDTKGWELVL